MSKIKRYKDLISGEALKNSTADALVKKLVMDGTNAKLNPRMDKALYSYKGTKSMLNKASKSSLKDLGSLYLGELDSLKTIAKAQNKAKNDYAAARNVAKNTLIKQYLARGGTALAGAGALTGAAYGGKKLYDKKREKTAFEIVEEAFDKI